MIIEKKVAVVLGGVRGIGRACVEALLSRGALVCFGDLLEDAGTQQETEYRKQYGGKSVTFVRCDATSDADIQRMFFTAEEYFAQRPEIVLTTVGIIDEFNWQKCIEVNVNGSIRLVNAARNIMGLNRGGQGGTVVITSSVSGLQPESWGPVYSATKHAVLGLARSWAEEVNFKLHGIRFNCLCPGAVKTEFLSEIRNSYHKAEHQKRIDTMELLKPEDISNVFIQILENDSINGQAFKILTEGTSAMF